MLCLSLALTIHQTTALPVTIGQPLTHFTVERFEVPRDKLRFLFFEDGRRLEVVKRAFHAKSVWAACFYAFGRRHGRRVFCSVDTYVVDGRWLMGSRFYPKVIAVYADGCVRIEPTLAIAREYGPVLGASAVADIPPKPNEALPRNMVAVKHGCFYHLSFRGTYKNGLWLQQTYGFKEVGHLDGGETSTSSFSPCIAMVL